MSDGNTLIVLDTASAEKFILTVCFVWLVVVSGGLWWLQVARRGSIWARRGGSRWFEVASGGSS